MEMTLNSMTCGSKEKNGRTMNEIQVLQGLVISRGDFVGNKFSGQIPTPNQFKTL